VGIGDGRAALLVAPWDAARARSHSAGAALAGSREWPCARSFGGGRVRDRGQRWRNGGAVARGQQRGLTRSMSFHKEFHCYVVEVLTWCDFHAASPPSNLREPSTLTWLRYP